MSCLEKENESRWFPVVFIVVFDPEFSFSTYRAALPSLVPYHTIIYTHRNTSFPTCNFAEFGRSRSNDTSVISEIHRKKLIPEVPHFKVTQGHCDWHGLIGYLWRSIAIMDLSYTVSKRNIGRKLQIAIFPTHPAFNAPGDGVPLGIW